MQSKHGTDGQNRGEEKSMRIRFYPDTFESDIIEVPDDITEEELNDMACEWVADNIPGYWTVVSGGKDDEDD